MKVNFKYFQLACVALIVLMNSCTVDDIKPIGNYGIKSEFVGGKTTKRFIYNDQGRIAEKEGLYNYDRYIYNNDGRLIKSESAMDPAMLSSSSGFHNKTTLMTSENSTISSYRIFHYDQKKLIRVENYFDKSGVSELRSINTFEYDGELISTKNIHNEKGEITQYSTYEYDSKGNVINEKRYSYLFSQKTTPRIISEGSFKYDNKKNPFKIFQALGNPGLYLNTNNVIEVTTINHELTPGIPQTSTSNTSYEYNEYGYPVKVIRETDSYEYRY